MTHVVKNNFEENVIDQNSQERSKKVSSSNIVQFQWNRLTLLWATKVENHENNSFLFFGVCCLFLYQISMKFSACVYLV